MKAHQKIALMAMGLMCLSAAHAVRDFQRGREDAAKPHYTEYAHMCRWLVHQNSWGVMAAVTSDAEPISGVLSFSDGPTHNSTGRVIIFLTPMDRLARSVMASPRVSLTVSEAQLLPQGCGTTDAQDPTCARVNVIGDVVAVPEADLEEARDMLLSRHPEMATWPADHGFKLYELHVRQLELLDWYGGMHLITAEQYFSADLLEPFGQRPQAVY